MDSWSLGVADRSLGLVNGFGVYRLEIDDEDDDDDGGGSDDDGDDDDDDADEDGDDDDDDVIQVLATFDVAVK